MRRIEEVIGDKIIDIINYVLSKRIKPNIVIDKVTQLDEEEIDRLKKKYGIEGIILDVDDTIRKNMKEIPKCNKDWIETLRGKIKIVVLSNGLDKTVEDYFRERGIDYIGFALKPLKKNFVNACEKMNLSPDKVLVIGDDLIDDIYGGKRNNMMTALVKNLEEER